jgi:hypothetical protein
MNTTDTRLQGLAILLALKQRGLGVGETAKAAGFERKWISRRIYGQVVPTNHELDEIAAIVGVESSYLRYHFRRPLRAAAVQ